MFSYASDDDAAPDVTIGGRGLIAALAVLAATAATLAALLPRLAGEASRASLVPAADAYVRLDREIAADFGMENPVVWVLEARDGTAWTSPLLTRLQTMTREVLTIPGVIALDVVSLASSNLRDVRMTDDGMDQVYLMGEVPDTVEAVAALRARVEADPNYRGTLASTDGRAFMLVANFRSDVDPATIGEAALRLRDHHSDAQADVYATGAAVFQALVPRVLWSLAAWVTASAAAGLLAGVFLLGMRAGLATALAVLLASTWAVVALLVLGIAGLPWTGYALPATALIAAAITVAEDTQRSARRVLMLALTLVAGGAALAVMAGAPAQAFGVALAAGGASAVAAGLLVRALVVPATAHASSTPWLRAVAVRRLAVAVLALAIFGLPRLRASFSLQGYGEHYLPAAATADLRALVRLFPPPIMLAVRVRGQPGFVASPAVLHAFDAVAEAARADPAVRSAMSLADVVKMVNRAFNDNRAEFLAIPDDAGLAGRYLALAYSPNFRRFVDRALATSVIWVYLDSTRPRDITRVLTRIEAQLTAHPVPGGAADLVGGDGAVILVMARAARRLAIGGVVLLLVVTLGAATFAGKPAVLRALLSGGATVAVAAGGFGWLGVPIDLVSLPCGIAAALAGAALGILSTAGGRGGIGRLSLTLAAIALPALVAPLTALHLLGVSLLAPVVGVTLAHSCRE